MSYLGTSSNYSARAINLSFRCPIHNGPQEQVQIPQRIPKTHSSALKPRKLQRSPGDHLALQGDEFQHVFEGKKNHIILTGLHFGLLVPD
jgi:hypothetical protein